MKELWLPVVGDADRYEISDQGRVRGPRGIRKPIKLKNGYLTVAWKRGGKTHCFYIHRLVAQTFIGPCPEGMEVLHGPGGKEDNRLANLRYGTASENQRDRFRDGTDGRGEKNPNAKLTKELVLEIRKQRAAGEGNNALARKFNVSPMQVSYVVRRKVWAHI